MWWTICWLNQHTNRLVARDTRHISLVLEECQGGLRTVYTLGEDVYGEGMYGIFPAKNFATHYVEVYMFCLINPGHRALWSLVSLLVRGAQRLTVGAQCVTVCDSGCTVGASRVRVCAQCVRGAQHFKVCVSHCGRSEGLTPHRIYPTSQFTSCWVHASTLIFDPQPYLPPHS